MKRLFEIGTAFDKVFVILANIVFTILFLYTADNVGRYLQTYHPQFAIPFGIGVIILIVGFFLYQMFKSWRKK